MPIIQDPRQNAGHEKHFGVVYMENDFELDEDTYQRGHYFYKKEHGSSNDLFNSRYFPHGFPVEVAGKLPGNQLPPALIQEYSVIFPNLQYRIVLLVKIHSEFDKKPPSDLDSRFPMAAYLHRCISHREDVTGAAGGRGLAKFNQGQEYVYERDNADVGRLIPL